MHKRYLLFLFLFAGCHKPIETTCVNYQTTWLILLTHDTTNASTGYAYTAYQPGSAFAVSEFSDTLNGSTILQTEMLLADTPFSHHFFQHDWIITLFPSNKQIRIRDIHQHQQSMKITDYLYEDGLRCVNGFSFYKNDTFINVDE